MPAYGVRNATDEATKGKGKMDKPSEKTFGVAVKRGDHRVYWAGKIGETDDFGELITDTFIDGKTTIGPWAIMTPASWLRYGVGCGTGKGQRYEKTASGRWLKVEG